MNPQKDFLLQFHPKNQKNPLEKVHPEHYNRYPNNFLLFGLKSNIQKSYNLPMCYLQYRQYIVQNKNRLLYCLLSNSS